MEPLLTKDAQASETAGLGMSRISTETHDNDFHSISTQSSLLKPAENNKKGWRRNKTQAITASFFKGSPKLTDYNFICYKYLILGLGIFSAIFTLESVKHLFVYFTPLLVHMLSLGLRGWDIFQLFKVFSALHRKDVKALEEAIILVKWFIGVYCVFCIGLYMFTSSAMVYLTGYLATAAYVDGDAVILRTPILSMIMAEISLYVLILCGAYGVRASLIRNKEDQKEREENFQIDL